MKRTKHASLKNLNSFSVEARAGQILELECEEDLQTFASEYQFEPDTDLVLGGGSNVLFVSDVPGSVILNRVTGRKIIADSDNEVLIEACGGENWHQLVLWSNWPMCWSLCRLLNSRPVRFTNSGTPIVNLVIARVVSRQLMLTDF